jgi:TolA-binding protein
MIFTDDLAEYNHALDLFQAEQYNAARKLFKEVAEKSNDETIKGNAAYYVANCAVRLNHPNADQLVEEFVEKYPSSTKRNNAVVDIAEYYFDNGNFNYARKWYDRVEVSTLSRKRRNKYYFNKGYTYVLNKRYDIARRNLTKVLSDPEYKEQANYYLGYMAYDGEELEEAAKLFEQVRNLPSNDDRLGYYKADLYYKLGDFESAIKMSNEYLPKANRKEASQLNRIIGQSLFNMKRYDEALPYIERYEGEGGRLNNNDFYQIGYVYYKQENYDKAIEIFNKIIGGKDATAQNAYYHLGQSYIRVDRKEDALNAFKLASELNFDAEITKDALYNYAKLSYEYGNPYDSVSAVIISYLDSYPEAENVDEMNDFLIDSYFTSKNYKEALKLMEGRRIQGNENVYGKVALFQGFNEFNNSEYNEAIENFNKTIAYSRDAAQRKQGLFWKAQAFYQLGDYRQALEHFKKADQISEPVKEDELLSYDLGYTHFQLGQYAEALPEFMSFVSSETSDDTRFIDATMRIADSYYVTKNYTDAISNYNKVIDANAPQSDYALFQRAMSRGFLSENDQKIKDLQKFIFDYDKSKYRDDVLYELGNTYINTGSADQGQQTYDQLIREFPNSTYTAPAMMRKGLQLYNDNKLDKALRIFKQVAERFNGTPQAVEAISSARQVYIDQGRTNDYADWVRGLDGIEVTDSELDDIMFESAEQPYVREKYIAAEQGMRKYLFKFPRGKHALKANFYLAQSLFAQGKQKESTPFYEKVLEKERNEFTEQALARLAEIYLKSDDSANSIRVLRQLEELADFPQNVIYAQSNLMKLYYEQQDYAQAAKYAVIVQNTPGVEQRAFNDAQVILARSYWEQGDYNLARDAYAVLRKNAAGSLGAEALYYKAYFEFDDREYDQVIKTVTDLSKNFGSYRLWANKGLILMGKSYAEKQELLNANTVFEAVVKNSTNYPELVEEARTELNKIKIQQAKTNSSVLTDDN